jgi:hypothetical protein
MSRPLFPAPPQTLAIKDPEAKNAIEMLMSAHNARNGKTDEAFATKAEVAAMIADATSGLSSGKASQITFNQVSDGASSVKRYVKLVGDTPQDNNEVMGWGADMTLRSGWQPIVPGHWHAVSDGTHSGNAWGIATEATNAPTKTGGLTTQLFGGEFSVNNYIPNSKAARHAGVLSVFKNRTDFQNYPAGKSATVGLGFGEMYNNATAAFYVDTGGGRVGSAFSGEGNPSIPCGWYRGLFFSPHSLDETTPYARNAVAIDMSQLDSFAPENAQFGGQRKFYDRLKSAIALPPNTPITWDGLGMQVKTLFNNQRGTLELFPYHRDYPGLAFQFDTGTIFVHGYDNQLNLGPAGYELLNMASGSKLTIDTIAHHEQVGFINIVIDGSRYLLPFYRA